MAQSELSVSLISSALTRPVLDGQVPVAGATLRTQAARSVNTNSMEMLDLKYDVAEMSLATFTHMREQGLPLDPDDLTYFLGRETIIVTRRKGMAIWREKLFVLMARNAVRPNAFFRLPPERVVELGVQVEM